MARATRAIFITWFPFHGRSDGIARTLGIRGWFSDGGRGPAALKDIRRWRGTSRVLAAERPDVVIVMQPPIAALWCVLRYARRSRARIVGDLHTGVFSEPVTKLAMKHTLKVLSRHGIAVVTNDALRAEAESHGCPALVVHDPIEVREPDLTEPDNGVLADVSRGVYVLVPLAYAHDEPIDELLAAAELAPDLRWVFTGRPPHKVRSSAPSNVYFPGYVSNADFDRAVSRAAVVVAMTTKEHTMQRAAYEALSFGRPLVTADTSVLSDYYRGAAELAAPRAPDIVAAVGRALADDTAPARMTELRARRISEQEDALMRLRDWVIDGPADQTDSTALR